MRISLIFRAALGSPRKLLAVVLAFCGFITTSDAAVLDMYGTMQWRQWGYRTYYYSAGQSGRYSNLGSAYYKSGDISLGYIKNRSTSGYSGSMSLEFWAMPYYGASSGYVKMTRSVGQLAAYYYFYNIYRSGYVRHLQQWRYAEFNLYEYTYNGWKWRDDFLFSSGSYL